VKNCGKLETTPTNLAEGIELSKTYVIGVKALNKLSINLTAVLSHK